MTQQHYRQGDILFIAAKAPRGKRKALPDGIVARGEATGHAHRLEAGAGVTLFDVGETMYISIEEGEGRVLHEEHGTIALPAGTWQVHRQREYSPEEIRNVAD